jgi:thiamine-monophosphate kinase
MKPAARLRDLGEEAVVAAITRNLPRATDVRAGASARDDCAVIGKPRDRWWHLLKTDAVVEHVHFLPETKPHRVGWKALCRPLSDIAAMAGTPEHALVTLAVAPETPFTWVQELYRGLRRAADRFSVNIVGGETCRSPGATFISVTLTGRVERTRCIFRSGGRVGDFLYVSGRLGGSLAGKHLDFTPRLREAQWLARHHLPSAMMDVSDGLAADLPRLAGASQCGYELDEGAVPRSPGCNLEQALGDGEDFELLFAIAPRRAARLEQNWKREFPRLPLTRIGTLRRSRKSKPPHAHGFDHFA